MEFRRAPTDVDARAPVNLSLEENYAKGGFGLKLAAGAKPALLIIDFVEAYLAKDSPLYAGVEPTRDAAVALLAAARAARLPIVHTYVEYEPGGRNGGVFFRKVPALKCFERGAFPEYAAFARGLEPAAGESVICKHVAGIDLDGAADRHPAHRRIVHERLRARECGGCVSARLRAAGHSRSRGRSCAGASCRQPVRPAGEVRRGHLAGVSVGLSAATSLDPTSRREGRGGIVSARGIRRALPS